jgi:ribosomal protein S18 acetylase RimI-like enzyme
VLLPGNNIIYLFTFPWADSLAQSFIYKIHKHLLSEGHQEIFAQPSFNSHRDIFEKLGYTQQTPQVIMIRPTEHFELKEPEGYITERPSADKADEIVKLAVLSDNSAEFTDAPNSPESLANEIKAYYKLTEGSELHRSASLLLRRKGDNELSAVCLISMWEELPLIHDIWVHPDSRRRGLAEYMIRYALSELDGHFPFVRLFVWDTNPAKNLYEKLDFMAGSVMHRMRFEVSE